jgi:hypothetical protein
VEEMSRLSDQSTSNNRHLPFLLLQFFSFFVDICSYVYEVEEMARLTDQSNLLATQSYLMSRCLQAQWATSAPFCEPGNLKNRVLAGGLRLQP